MKIIAGLLLVFLIASCYPVALVPDPKTPTEDDIKYCDIGCKHLQSLVGRDGAMGCEESRDLIYPSGAVETCRQFCEDTQRNGRWLNPKCWANEVTKCEEIETKCRR